jgi:Fic family protein
MKRGDTGTYEVSSSGGGSVRAFVPHPLPPVPPVSFEGDWGAWLSFFLEGVKVTAEGAVETAHRLAALFAEDRARLEPRGRRAGSALRVHDAIKARPILSMPQICRATGLSFPAASSAIDLLVETGIVRELTGRRRNRLFVNDRYLSMLNEGTQAS